LYGPCIEVALSATRLRGKLAWLSLRTLSIVEQGVALNTSTSIWQELLFCKYGFSASFLNEWIYWSMVEYLLGKFNDQSLGILI